MAIRASLSSLLLLAFCVVANAENLVLEEVSLDALLHSSPSTIPRVTPRREGSIEIIHRKTSLSEEDHHAAFAKDSLRVASIQKRVSYGSVLATQPTAGLNLGASRYAIPVAFGTPAKTQNLIFDTSSDVCWIQCQPCMVMCHPQHDRLFDPARSSTFSNFSCHSSTCEALPRNGCYEGNCRYFVDYGDGSYTTGFLVSDTLRMDSTKFENFVFGCGQQDRGLSKLYAGLLGLGRSIFSLNSQVAFKYGNIFYYCLPPKELEKGYLEFGLPRKAPYGYTPMLTDPRAPNLYFLNLTGITVNGKKLDVPPSVFQSTGTIIDSGTEITRLPPAVYNALKTAFHAHMTAYPPAAAFGLMDTCYDFSKNKTVRYPVITFHYDGVDVTLPPSGVFYGGSASQICLALAGNSDASQISIIGSIQQTAMDIIYDNDFERIGFAEGKCG